MADIEVTKLQKHLTLLRQEYIKLQSKCVDIEKKLSLANAATGEIQEDSYISQLLRISNNLFERETFSDITVKYANKSVRAHKLILAARSQCWCADLNDVDELLLDGVSCEVGNMLIKWVYTDHADVRNDESVIIELVKAANRYKLKALRTRCEQMLMSAVSVANCIRFYQTAEDIGAESLRTYCGEIIATHWDDLETKDFLGMSAPLLYEMFKTKSNFPLHFAVRHHREDVVFLYLIEHNLQIPAKLNEIEPHSGLLPLQIALKERQESIAKTLVLHNCDVNMANNNGETLLHQFIREGDTYASIFLIENGADVKASTKHLGETPLHLAASYKYYPSKNNNASEAMGLVAKHLLDYGSNINALDSEGRTALHVAVAASNKDVFNVLLAAKTINLESRDNNGNVVLWTALLSYKESLDSNDKTSYASMLIKNGSNPNAVNPLTGDSLLHLAATFKNEHAGLFLIDHGAHLNHTNKLGESPLHIASRNGLLLLVEKLLKSGANPNYTTTATDALKAKEAARKIEFQLMCDESRRRIIMLEKSKAMKRVKEIRELLQEEEKLKLQKKKSEIKSYQPESTNPFSEDDNSNAYDGNPFLDQDEEEGLQLNQLDRESSFLNEMQAASSAAMALTSSSMFGYQNVNKGGVKQSKRLITSFDGRIDVQLIQSPTDVEKFDFDAMQITQLDIEDGLQQDVITDCWNCTPLHFAVIEKQEEIVKCFIKYSENASLSGGRLPIVPDFNVLDSAGQTPLLIALLTKQYKIGKLLVNMDVDLNICGEDHQTLLHKMIMHRNVEACLFLLENGADVNKRSKENMSPLQMAIHLRLTPVVEALCIRGADVNSSDEDGNTALWVALKSHQLDIASSLVKHGADTDFWSTGINNCVWTLLHRAIFERDEETACFLIRNKCDLHSPRRPGLDGGSASEGIDGLTPLHLACASSQDKVVQCLIEHNADINMQDADGRAPIHIAIAAKNPIITRILLSHPDMNFYIKDTQGQTPFIVAMNCRDNDASTAILAREPYAAEQFDNKGRNYLHKAIMNKDVDVILFLISIEVNVNSVIMDGSQRTPLHLAVPTGNEIVVRHLILAGADVNAVDKNRQTPLHCAAIEDKPSIISVLLQNGSNPDLVDISLNNALHLACQHGNLASVRTLLTESSINAEVYNIRSQNSLHVLAAHSSDNAAAIFDLFRQTMPNYPFDALDGEENTALFIAYSNGAVGLCCALLKAGARLATMNKHGVSVFNAPVATKKLLFKLLDLLNAEPSWSDGPNCHECGDKFGITTRKHHCRHCGRLLCSKCTTKQMPILKYDLTKPVRVCEVCFQFLTT
ncbi:rabankyrin-5 isoform X3 [Hydra vulgaris]|uniref:rabankyrin-5 isoform X3 n=1 Tax=Hydra vulgaris TaxID=6087 RepID=UPI001F5EEE8D|nr:rabankyrin-5 isoform X3 [Hydra vulgaris]